MTDETPNSSVTPAENAPAFFLSPLLFSLIFFSPLILLLLGSLVASNANERDAIFGISLLLSFVTSIICGAMSAKYLWRSRSLGLQILMGIVHTAVLFIVICIIDCFGCMMALGPPNFH